MSINVDLEIVRKKLEAAYNVANSGLMRVHESKAIDAILLGNPKTVKYFLLTALAAKAAENKVDPLCLQAGADSPGAYDARSVCHKCIVVFEREKLGNSLGGSNEPYLNKPARVPKLDKSNATKGGEDKINRDLLIDFLTPLQTSDEAFDYLTYAIYRLLRIKEKSAPLSQFRCGEALEGTHAKVFQFSKKLLERNNGGEMLTLVVSAVYNAYLQGIYRTFKVDVHHVNQSGASSRQISDSDIFIDNQLFMCNELKDKSYSREDVQHAVQKVKDASFDKMNFIVGLDGQRVSVTLDEYTDSELAKGFLLNVIPAQYFIGTLISLTKNISVSDFVNYLLLTARANNFTTASIKYIKETARETFGEV